MNILKEERRLREEGSRAEGEMDNAVLTSLLAKAVKAEAGIVQTTKELLSVRHE